MESDGSYASSDEPKKKPSRGKPKKNPSSSSTAKNKSKDTSLLKQSTFPTLSTSHFLSLFFQVILMIK